MITLADQWLLKRLRIESRIQHLAGALKKKKNGGSDRSISISLWKPTQAISTFKRNVYKSNQFLRTFRKYRKI